MSFVVSRNINGCQPIRGLIGPEGENHQSYPLTHGDNTAFINLDNKKCHEWWGEDFWLYMSFNIKLDCISMFLFDIVSSIIT